MRRARAPALLALGLLPAGLLFVPACHSLYWAHPLVFAGVTVIGAGAALAGGFLAGRSLGPVAVARWIMGLTRGVGTLLSVVSVVLGLAALLMAASIAGTGYWGAAPHDYSGDYVVLLLQIRLVQAAAMPGGAGGLLLGVRMRLP